MKRKAIEIKHIAAKQWIYFNTPAAMAISLLLPLQLKLYGRMLDYLKDSFTIFITILAILLFQVFIFNKNTELLGSGPLLEVEEKELPDLSQWEP